MATVESNGPMDTDEVMAIMDRAANSMISQAAAIGILARDLGWHDVSDAICEAGRTARHVRETLAKRGYVAP